MKVIRLFAIPSFIALHFSATRVSRDASGSPQVDAELDIRARARLYPLGTITCVSRCRLQNRNPGEPLRSSTQRAIPGNLER
jgi:hypothetical protein